MLDQGWICVEDQSSKTPRNLTPSSPVAASMRSAEEEQRSSRQIYLSPLGKSLRSIGLKQHLACLVKLQIKQRRPYLLNDKPYGTKDVRLAACTFE